MKSKKQSIYLFLSGTTLLLVGTFIALWPGDYLSQFSVGIEEAQNNFLSEIRGMGGGLLIFGLYILVSLVQKGIRDTALTLSLLVFSAFVIFRVLSMLIDGVPGQGIFIALFIELILALGAIGLVNVKSRQEA